ncbi:type II toxin-antitoxin system RelE/ParE family toxin [Mannheimia sp. ZY171111]|uniref:type II toxin-antitoxin system RelE/ParE family toxin n=1 Tax=Mannheimia sp. ZY171111 TaxID=2679995 RepID=UPI001ADDC95A|nr:type II toxin-antitoxin system RelE/ParE family toxin [Mannheimia sp. ZY171111]QTM02027.1 type II toxin-antitoxin system RelE/ParE family toxin [Mannheimia sp. ZY171111]
MKVDYIVQWSNEAEEQLNKKADYIAEQSSREIAANFFDDIKTTAEKLSYIAGAYNDGKFHKFPVSKRRKPHSVRFIVVGDFILISDFIPAGKNS